MGLTTFSGGRVRKADIAIAKNYLSHDELDALNRVVTAYLEFAELQALSRKPMYMHDWITKLDDFLKLSDRDILTHAGSVSHEDAVAKAGIEYDRFATRARALPSPVEEHFNEALREVKQIEKQRPSRPRRASAKKTAKKKTKKRGPKKKR